LDAGFITQFQNHLPKQNPTGIPVILIYESIIIIFRVTSSSSSSEWLIDWLKECVYSHVRHRNLIMPVFLPVHKS
jgi:hypothetical protein